MNCAAAMVEVQVDDALVHVLAGSSVAAALAQRASGRTRLSVSGQWRAPLCGMGVCYECRVLINGRERLACQTLCEQGMHVTTSTARPGDAA